jgi:hypothetical protein
MTINDHLNEFAGLPVAAYPDAKDQHEPADVAWRIDDPDYEGGDIFKERLAALRAEPWADQVVALVLGSWGSTYDSAPPIDALADAAHRFTALRAVFLGDITAEECEISWIVHTDITPLLEAYPRLETLAVRGSSGLSLKPLRLPHLHSLTFESGGLPAEIVTAVGECDLPVLTHLELWLGTENYGGDATVDDLTQILTGSRLPALISLGLRDAEIADQVAAALASAPIVARLEQLDLSLGMLTDVGASALMTGQPLTHLRKLDLHHHFLTDAVMQRLRAELGAADVELDLSEGGDPEDEDRYIAVSE